MKVANIVFYKVPNGTTEEKIATIFYQDGTVRTVSFEDGIDACESIVREKNIQTKDAFKEMINRDVVHVMSATDFKAKFNSFIPAKVSEAIASTENKADAVEEKKPTATAAPAAKADDKVTDKAEEKKETASAAPVVAAAAATAATTASKDDGLYHFTDEEEKAAASTKPATVTPADDHTTTDPFSGEDDFDNATSTVATTKPAKKEEPEKKPGFFKRLWTRIKESKVVKRVVLCGLALAMAFGIYSCSQRKTLEGTMNRSNIPTASATDDSNMEQFNNDSTIVLSDETLHVTADVTNVHYYNNARLQSLLAATTNQTQKTAMSNIGLAMDGFNNNFASYYVEEGIDVRPSLKFDEVMSLQLAYNDYSKDQLRAYFNGTDIHAADLTRAYKDANLQLMGAYAIENAEHPVDMSMLIESEEGRAFYQRYHAAFLAAKMATGEDKVRLVNDFYAMVRADFPISQEVRTEGISHSSNYDSLEPYKLAVTPMIAAGEMMWQNLETDVTLNDMEIDFINDLGLCNYADKSFERAELVALTSDRDNNNPTLADYRAAFIEYYTTLGTYYVNDEHRELTKLQSFQDAVNWHFDPEGEWTYQGQTWTETETHTEEHHWTETTTEYHEETETHAVDESEVPEEVREDLQHQVDADLEAENERRRQQALKDAEAERERLQAIEDANAQKVEEEVKKDDADLQQHINDANETINHNNSDTDTSNDTPVNETDLGHGVDFDDQHSDENGNLDSSVQNITTDPTGDMTDQPLPDPNETGRDFDARGEQNGAANNPDNTAIDYGTGTVESVPVDDGYYYEDSWIEYDDAVSDYVESMGATTEAEEGYQYQH